MKPSIRHFNSPDIPNFEDYAPSDPSEFYFLLQIIIGPDNGPGEESFDVVVCSPKSFAKQHEPRIVEMGRHYLFMNEYNRDALVAFIRNYCDQCEGVDWEEVATKCGRLGKWEFEDYQS